MAEDQEASTSGIPDSLADMRSPSLSSADMQATHTLLSSLYSFGQQPDDDAKLSKLLRHTDHDIKGKGKITSWKMQDYAYKRDPCPYPTRARGLFTAGTERIVARAYDKFFNVDEVSWTKWANLPDLTAAPYYLTLKSNGCLILVAALTPDSLLVTSKHAIGQAKEAGAVSHAEMGERWLERHLQRASQTREDLAARLWKENWTLVAELCDDSFEEHILAYPAEKSGLHLHGIVCNHPTLLTHPPPHVNRIASEFGFIETPYITLSSVDEVRAFTNRVAETGQWEGQYAEGFVVRAALKSGSLDKQPQPNDLTEENWQDERRTFMWKIKFDQPYLMWREWREVTKKILSSRKKAGDDVAERGRQVLLAQGKGKQREHVHKMPRSQDQVHIEEAEEPASLEENDIDSSPKQRTQKQSKKEKKQAAAQIVTPEDETPADAIRLDRIRNSETRLYITWLQQHMRDHPEAFAGYMDNRGIVAVREDFLQWKETNEGKQAAIAQNEPEAVNGSQEQSNEPFEKTLIVPVAVPGCGKTLIGVALSHLFGFAHTQSDDVKEKKAAKHFETNVTKLLDENNVVFADKNNHLKQHREVMADIASKASVRTRLVALVWPLDKLSHNEVHRICADRIVGRGENHQSLRPMKTGEHELILMRFFSQYEQFDSAINVRGDAKFDEILELDLSWDFETSLKAVIELLVRVLDLAQPSDEQIREAMAKTKDYKPALYKEMKVEGIDANAKGGGKNKGVRYYGIAVEVDLPSLLEDWFQHHPEVSHRKTFDLLKETKRIETKPHVTLVHEKELEALEDGSNASEAAYAALLWERCKIVSARWGDDAVTATLTLGPLLVWDDRAMCIQVSEVTYAGKHLKEGDVPNDERKDSYHITVGTINQDVRPVEGRWLLESALKGEKESRAGRPIDKVEMKTVQVKGRVKGLF